MLGNTEFEKKEKVVSHKSFGVKDCLHHTKNNIRNTLAGASMLIGSVAPNGIPAAIESSSLAQATGQIATKAITLGTSASLLSSCYSIHEEYDITSPDIAIYKRDIDISGGKMIFINGNQLYLGDELIASRDDNVSINCQVTLSVNGNYIHVGDTIQDDGRLVIKIQDEAGNTKTATILLRYYNQF